MEKIRIKALKKLKRVQKDLQKCKGRVASKIQEILMEAQSFLMTTEKQQLCMRLR